MAVMWPRDLPVSIRQDRRRRAEVRVYDKLAAILDDSFTVFYSSPWLGTDHLGAEKDGECDFLVAHARLGYLAIEVKGGGISFDPEAAQWWSTDAQHFRHKIKDPVNQARSAKHELLKKLKASGRWRERFIHISHGVIFPDAVAPPRDLGTDRPTRIFCCSREFADGLRQWIGRRLDEGRNPPACEPLGQDGLAAFTQILASPFQLHFSVSAAMADAAEHMGVLEPTQFHILDHIADITRAEIRGGAGTGKTVIAAEEAMRLASSGKRTLLTCYSSPLAAELGRRLAGIENLTISSFHSVCGQVAARAGLAIGTAANDQQLFDELLPAALIDAIDLNPGGRWDAIVVDEGQDFLPTWWVAISTALAPGGTLRVMSDSNQRVYATGRVPCADLELVPIRLKRNLRNTRAIHSAAQAHYEGPDIEPQGPEGHPVSWIPVATRQQLAEAAYAELRRLVHREEVAPSDIAILFPSADWFEPFRIAAARSDFDFATCDDLTSDTVIIDTVRRFKGLERPAVILVVTPSDMVAFEMAYVGISRPRTYLAVIATEGDYCWLRPEQSE
ncbi:nuclease-related domain-containing DEAD/DEAH box helicase [Sphingobium sp.]|uniref:nuclease-related domain-containing DEAD/DEAH box helicase n=1 Tax=Sphingobium sp. TaxID=1912891 RepID=UPI002E24E112